MTADNHTHREPVNPHGAHGTDVQRLATLLQQCGGSTTIDYLRELSMIPEPRLRDALDELQEAERISVHTGLKRVRVDLLEEATNDHRIVADGSGVIDDVGISITTDEIFELLSSARRRELIKQISNLTPEGEEAETHLELRPLSTWTVMARTGRRVTELSKDEQHRAYVSLTQVHAEALDESDVAEYHQRVKKLTPTEDIHALAAIVEAVEAAAGAGVKNGH